MKNTYSPREFGALIGRRKYKKKIIEMSQEHENGYAESKNAELP